MKRYPNRIDLEDVIMEMDHLTDNLDLVLENLDELTEDQLSNVLIGYRELHKLRYAKLWDTFKRVYRLDEYRESLD